MLISIKSGIFRTLFIYSLKNNYTCLSKKKFLSSLLNFSGFFIVCLLFLYLTNSNSYAEVYKDNFPGGKTELRWNFFPHFFLDNLTAQRDQKAPDGDKGIGILRNANAGGFAALSYAVTEEVSNFTLEAYVYCQVSNSDKSPLSGLAFLIDPVNSRFYRFVCDFNKKEPNLNIAYVGKDTRHFPVYLKFWRDNEIPGGTPKTSGWNKMRIMVKNGKGVFFWNDIQLKGEFDLSRISKGFVGVYANFVGGMGIAETKVDSFILKSE